MSEAMLTVREWGKTGQVSLKPEGTVIGRHPDCEVVIDSRDVSRRHARVYRETSGTWFIQDLDSSNGTFVQVHRYCQLKNGDRVLVGSPVLEYVAPEVRADVAGPGGC